ncbi:MAG: hypothetical protein RXR41_03415 [Candidatus Marsarchaeota archaeon]
MLEDELKAYVRTESAVPKSEILSAMAKKGYEKASVEGALESMVRSGMLICKRRGRTVSYALPGPDLLAMLQQLLEGQRRIERALTTSTGSFEREFDSTYQKVKDVAGIATLKDIREAMNMEAPEFYAKFEKISNRYKLSPGGVEGLIKDGNVWGVILGIARAQTKRYGGEPFSLDTSSD